MILGKIIEEIPFYATSAMQRVISLSWYSVLHI